VNARIEILDEKKLVGKRVQMSFAINTTKELWQSFMPGLKQVTNRIGTELFSAEVYPPLFFQHYNVNTNFEKWAAVEVAGHDSIPPGMEAIVFPAGLYAVFIHKGTAAKGEATYRYIYMDWLPDSGFELDNRPHFAVMGEKYKRDDDASEEEIWIPVRPLAL
jgi:AraC family transcriptional regulator